MTTITTMKAPAMREDAPALRPAREHFAEAQAKAETAWRALEDARDNALRERDQERTTTRTLEADLATVTARAQELERMLEDARQRNARECETMRRELAAVTLERDRYKNLWAKLTATMSTSVEMMKSTIDAAVLSGATALSKVLQQAMEQSASGQVARNDLKQEPDPRRHKLLDKPAERSNDDD